MRPCTRTDLAQVQDLELELEDLECLTKLVSMLSNSFHRGRWEHRV